MFHAQVDVLRPRLNSSRNITTVPLLPLWSTTTLTTTRLEHDAATNTTNFEAQSINQNVKMHINAATAALLLPMIGVVAQHGHKHAEHHHHKKHAQGPEHGCATITKVVTVTAGLDAGQISASNPPVTSTVTSTVELTVTSTVTVGCTPYWRQIMSLFND